MSRTPPQRSSESSDSDPIIALDQWQGVVAAYDFNPVLANAFNVHLIADAAAFAVMTEEQAGAALQTWTTIYEQIASPSVSFAVDTNLALQANSSMTLINLDDGQADQVVALAKAMVDYLQSGAALPNVTLSFNVSGSGTLPPAFEISVLFRIQRDAQTATSPIASKAGRSLPDFAAAFAKAFPQLALAVAVGSNRLNSLWAVQRVMLDVTIGGTNNGPFFSAPMPLDNRLHTSLVNLQALPESLVPDGTNLPSQQLFADVDLDRLNSGFFQAVDDNTDIDTASARETLANLYATRQIDWLFANDANGNPSPYTGSDDQLQIAKAAFEQQMRDALATAYTIDTIVQCKVSWSDLPPTIGDFYALHGTVVTSTLAGATISAPIKSGGSTLTFLIAIDDVQDRQHATLNLAWNITHLEILPEGQDRPSMQLQLVDPFPKVIGDVDIPFVLRAYPAPPTMISHEATAGSSQPSSGNALVDAAAWHFTYAYQAELTAHDRINTSIVYNTNLSANDESGRQVQRDALFEALARFSATYPAIEPVLATHDDSPTWNDAANVFRGLVNDVANNSNWDGQRNTAAPVLQTTDAYQINDVTGPSAGERTISLTWDAHESSFDSAKLSIEALDPATTQPYPNQTHGSIPNGVTDLYTPAVPQDRGALHQVDVANLNVLLVENALAAVQLERNLIGFPVDRPQWFAKNDYVYRTPIVRAAQPVTLFVDNDSAIDVAALPKRDAGESCSSLCRNILAVLDSMATADIEREVNVACSYHYPLGPISSVVPVVLARSFLTDRSDFSATLAAAIANWASDNAIMFGSDAEGGAQFVFDVTLYAQLSEPDTPLLRLRNLQLNLADVTP